MIKLYRKLFLLALLSGFLLVSPNSFAQTFAGGVSPDMCVGNPTYVSLSAITITENNILDFSIDGTPGTIVIAPSTPSLFEFEPGTGSISFTGLGVGSVTALLTVTATEITIQLSESDADNETDINSIIISGVQVRAINSPASLQLQNVGGSGPFTINGFSLGDDITSSILESFASPTAAAAGTDRTGVSAICGTSTALAANTPAIGDGEWSFVSNPDGLGVISNVLSPTSSFSGTPGQTYELQWTISNGPCTPSTDNVLIHFDPTLSAAVAGDDQDVCGTVTSLNATTPTTGVGTWSFVSNPDALGAISNVNSATSLFSGAAGSVYILRWTVTGGSCGALQDDVTIRFIAAPTTSQAGPNQSLCESITFTLAANSPGVGTGGWTVQSGTATVTNPLSPTSAVTGIPIGSSATLRWRITNGACPASVSDVVLTNYQTIPDTDAGVPLMEQCNNGTFVMNASPATGVNTGSWSIVSGSASITNLNSPTTTITGVSPGSSVLLRWTVSNGGVCPDKWDEIELHNYPQTSVSNAGSDINLCNTASFTMAATPPSVGTGAWSLISGTASITDVTAYNTTVGGVAVGASATLRWTISNGACGNSTDDVVITNYPTVPDTDAGVAVFQQCNTSTFIMNADPAGVNTGTWTLVNGSAIITNIHSPTTTVTGLAAGSSATLRWTVSNGVCLDKSDDIILENHRLPTPANAGSDIELCSTANFTLNGNNPTYGTGVWSLVAGSASITDVNLRNTTVTGVAEGASATLRWTITNGVCASSTDDVVVYNRGALPAVNAGGPTITQCNTSIFEMNASNPAPGIGTWSIVSGTASITNINSPTTTITGVLAGNTVVLRWTVSNGGICTPVSDNVSLVNLQPPTAASTGTSPINQCDNTSFTMAANSPSVGIGAWSIVSGSATIADPSSPTTTVTGVTAGTSVTLRWSITNGICPASTSDVMLSNYGTPPTANAGLVSIIQCNSGTFTMTANSAGSGVGAWTVVSGIATITNTASPSTTITGVPLGTSAILRWTITSPSCPPTFDDILLTNDRPPSVANAGFDINQGASSTFTLNAQVPVYGTGAWTIISGDLGVAITDASSPTSTVTGVLAGTSATLRWTVSNGSCPSSVDDVVLTNYATPPVADAGPPFMSQCNNGTFVMVANDAPLPATGLWTIQSGSATITNPSLHTTTITDVVAGTSVVLRWTISDGVNPPTFDNITLNNFELPSASLAGPDIQQCNNANFTMAATPPTVGTGVWSLVNGTASITTNTSATTTVSGVPVGTSATLRWTVTNGVCTGNVDDVVLTNFSTPNSAEAGPAVMQQCNTSTFVMAATSAGTGIGVWTLQSGVGTITNINSPTTTVTGVPAGANAVLRWTVGNGVCTPTYDEITLTNFQLPTVSNAGLDINQCNNDSFTLNGNVPAIGTGAWAIVSGPGVITTSTAYNTTVTGVTAGMSTTLRWTITNGVCTGSVDDVVLTNRITPPIADAGLPSITQCNNSTFTMNANAPSPGVGEWTIVSGSATIVNTGSRTTTVTNVVAGTSVVLRWTISNGGVCAPTSDDITLTNDQLPTVSNAGLDINQCNNDSFTLNGNVPAIGTGAWTIVSGPGVITTSAAYNTTVIGVTAGMSTTLRWSITNGSVCASSTDDVVITNRITPPVADAHPSPTSTITQCNNGTFTMNANVPSPGVGEWTIVSGVGTITNTSSRTTTVTGVAAGAVVVLRWTISNGGVCPPTSDDVTLINDQLPTISNAGVDINQCATDEFTLSGNIPSIGTGVWTIVSGPGSITTPSAHNTTVTGVTAGMSTTLRWTITNGSVCASSVDDVVITNRITPPVADAHPSPTSTITQCNNGTFTMNANVPSPGVGEWTIVSGLATITNTSSRTTTVTGVAAGAVVVLRWTISNGGVCPPTSDDVTLINDQLPTISNAGLDINQCNNDSFTLNGNAPAIGTGAWTIVSGPGSITTPSAHNTIVTGVTAGMSTTLRWTITNGSVCASSVDDVVLTNRITPPIANAEEGSPVTEQCNNSTFVMSANAPVHGVGLWTVIAGTAVITNTNSNTTTITGVAVGTSVTLRWTISNGGVCAPTSDDIILTNYRLPSVSNAGIDISQCENATFTLAGNIPTYGTGSWAIVSGPGVITTTSLHNTTVTGVTAGSSTTLRWTIANGVCTASVDDVVITNRITPPAAEAGLALIEQCNNSTFIMTANDPINGVGAWTIVSGSAVITNPSSYTTTITSVMPGTSVVLRWTISNGGVCASTSDDITLTNFHQPTTSLAGSAQSNCNNGSFTLAANTPIYGTGTWSIVGPSNGSTIATLGSPTSTVTGLQAGTSVTLRWTISNGMCTASTSEVVLTNTLGVIVDAGSNVQICQGTTFNFSSQTILASASNYATLLWESVGTPPTGVLYNATTLTPTYQPGVGETGLLRFRLTATGLGVCTPVTDVMEIMITPAPIVNAGSDEQICEGTTTLNFATRTLPATSAHGSLSWTHTGSGSLSSSSILNPVYTVGSTDVGALITFRLTVTSGSPTVCSQVFDEFTLKVNPTTVVTIPGGDFSVCEPATIELMGQMQGSAIAGSWSIVSGGGSLSVSSITVSGSIKTVRATYTRLPSEINTVLTFRLSTNDPDDSGPCTIVTTDVNVTVDESAKVFAGVDMNICEYNSIPLSGTFNGAATSVTWSGGLSPGQFSNATNAITNYNLVTSEVNANNLSYVFTLTTNDPIGVCPAVSDAVLVNVIDRLPPGDITIIGLNPVYAENDPSVSMVGVPGGGVFAGDAVSGNRFFPNIAKITPLVNVVTYSVTDVYSCVSTHTQNVIVNPITDVDFRIDTETIDALGVSVICANQGDVKIIEIEDKDIPNLVSPENVSFQSTDLPPFSIEYNSTLESFVLKTNNLVAGTYTITYFYTNELGATNPFSRSIRIASSPLSIIDNTNICETAQANFIESSYVVGSNPTSAVITGWLWDFGDGNGSSNQNPTYNYAPGVYNVKLKVTTNEGCSHESTKVINVGSTPEMKFDWTEFCNGSFTNFVDQTIVSVGSIVNYKWTFGDGYEISGPAGSTIASGSNDGYTEGVIAEPKHEYQVAGQQYNVTLEVQTDVGCVESITRTAFILEYETPSPIDGYFEDFEAGNGSWFANRIEKLTPTDTSWVFGSPTGSVINSAASGNNAWWTGGNPNAGIDLGTNKGIEATYFNNEKSAVIGPCQDLSGIKRPMISVDYWSDTQSGSDGAVLQYSINGGIHWEAIGEDTGNGINWYNGRAITGSPGGQIIGQFGWTGNQTPGWRTARYNLDQIDPDFRSQVIFRIAFGSNNDNGNHSQTFNGFAFDNIYIGEKKRTVMVEYFTNAGINQSINSYFDALYDNQMDVLLKDSSDFFKVQYHISSPISDPINLENEADPRARSIYYGVRQPPVGIMDGILGNYYGTTFDGNHQKITVQEIDRRALEDPLFNIEITNMVADPVYTDSLKFRVNFEYVHPTQTLSNPVTYQVALLEDSVGGLGTNRNVLRKFLLGTEGKTVNHAWTYGQNDFVDIKTSIDVPIGNNNRRLYLVAFVQDRKLLDDSKIIHQAIIQRAPVRSGKVITGVDDDPVLAQVKNINVYPNPASQVINFRTEQPLTRDYEWSIIDQRGVTVLTGKLDHDLTIPQQVELRGIADGVYIVAIKQGNRPLIYRKIAVLKRG